MNPRDVPCLELFSAAAHWNPDNVVPGAETLSSTRTGSTATGSVTATIASRSGACAVQAPGPSRCSGWSRGRRSRGSSGATWCSPWAARTCPSWCPCSTPSPAWRPPRPGPRGGTAPCSSGKMCSGCSGCGTHPRKSVSAQHVGGWAQVAEVFGRVSR